MAMRPVYRLVSDFIIPSLENRTFGRHLEWEDRDSGSFKISRVHQSSELWKEECIEVYKAWSTKKNHWNPKDPKKITKAKHRLITALRRNPDIETLTKVSAFYRFRIINLNTTDLNSSSEGGIVVSSTMKENHEIAIYLNLEDNENQEVRNDPLIFKEQQNLTMFNGHEATMNSGARPLYQSEFYMQRISMQENFIGDVFYEDEGKPTKISTECCCEILGENVLCNPKCIWHGMPP